MKVVHIESGLGNQMLSYCEYLALRKMNPDDDIYIETIIYEIPECNDYICQWNGYELAKVFGISTPNIKCLFSEEEWRNIIQEITETRFWEKNWNYPIYITQILNRHGLQLKNYRGDFETKGATLNGKESDSLKSKIRKTLIGYYLKKLINSIQRSKILKETNKRDQVFVSTDEDIFTGQRLSLKYVNNGIEEIDREIRDSFIFPEMDGQNKKFAVFLQGVNGVAIHARRGDMLGFNADCYKYGYFRRSVKYMKKHVDSPVFVFFCDPGSVTWCKENYFTFGLDKDRDQIFFVDWNKGDSSFRDLQLMSYCKHQIITNSSFGWWGAYLNNNPSKITCSPDIRINTTHHF